MKKIYLGDSVYAEFDGYSIILTTDNGYPDDPRNRIVMEPEVINALNTFIVKEIVKAGILDDTPERLYGISTNRG
jgi:hypothetical protein